MNSPLVTGVLDPMVSLPPWPACVLITCLAPFQHKRSKPPMNETKKHT